MSIHNLNFQEVILTRENAFETLNLYYITDHGDYIS